MSHTTVFIIMDAGRADHVRPETMPFVHALAERSMHGAFDSPPGYAPRTVLFSGRYPDTSGRFGAYVYDPDNSPYAWVRRLGPFAGFVRPRKMMFPARVAIARTTERITGTHHADPAWIPTRFLPYFRPCEDMRPVHAPGALGSDSIFDLCRQNDKTFRYLVPPKNDNGAPLDTTLVRELRTGSPYDLYVAHVTADDHNKRTPAHAAPSPQQLRDLDDKIASIHAALSAGYDTWDLFLCGDRGSVPVERRVNLLAALKDIDAEPVRDYVVFVNSTLAMFWYHTAKGRRAIEALLPRIHGTKTLDDDERRRMRIPTDRAWGDRMLAADPGVLFWPDYFHVADTHVDAMHGYLDKREETRGIAVLASNNGHTPAQAIGTRPLVDAFPTLCDLINVPTPPNQEGASLLREVEPIAARPTVRRITKEAERELHRA